MPNIAYHFHVMPRYHDHFHHAYRASHFTLQQTLGLVAHQFAPPQGRHDAFELLLSWDSQASFERFTRTWFGVWIVNGMGLSPDAFTAPIQTHIKLASGPTQANRRAA